MFPKKLHGHFYMVTRSWIQGICIFTLYKIYYQWPVWLAITAFGNWLSAVKSWSLLSMRFGSITFKVSWFTNSVSALEQNYAISSDYVKSKKEKSSYRKCIGRESKMPKDCRTSPNLLWHGKDWFWHRKLRFSPLLRPFRSSLSINIL